MVGIEYRQVIGYLHVVIADRIVMLEKRSKHIISTFG